MTLFSAQSAGYQRFAGSWIALVDAGCNRVSGTESSTKIVQLPDVLAAFSAPVVRELSRGKRRRKSANGKRLRICIYARYSTEEQDETSIADQFAFCLKFLASLDIDLDTAIIEKFADPETSGETVYLPGIDQVRQGVEDDEWDIIVCEDVSRLFRNLSACCDLVETAYDKGIRFVAINDDVDSDESGWEDRFYDAAQHHAKSNRFTSNRIKRKLAGLWGLGAAMGPLRSGHRRIYPSEEYEGKGRRRRKKPKFDEIDDEWKDTVYEAFERIAAGEDPWIVADWLTREGLPKCSNARDKKKWTDKNVIALIRNTIYRGLETYPQTTSLRKKRTGKKRQIPNDPSQIQSREMPHWRIVPDWLWYAANEKINDRMVKKESVSGDDHPLWGIERDSRFPLSKLIICDCCDDKMWADGLNEGGYRCKHARSGKCWNKTTARRDFAHAQISKAVTGELLTLDGVADVLAAHIGMRVRDDDLHRQEEKSLRKDVQRLQCECAKLGESIASREGDDVPVTLVDMLVEREQRLGATTAELESVQHKLKSPPTVSVEQIQERIVAIADQLLDLDRGAGPLLARLIDGKIRAVPHLQFDSTKVVLRAEFDFRPVGILPDELLAVLSGEELDGVIKLLPSKRIVVDLFKPSLAPKHAMSALKIKDENPRMTLAQLGEALGISKRTAHLALELGRKMRVAGIEDSYIRLTERPEKVARWR